MPPIISAVGLLICVSACNENEAPSIPPTLSTDPSDYIQLKSRGGWGINTDITIRPDDSFEFRTYESDPQGNYGQRHGKIGGIFTKIVSLTDKSNAWEITTDSLVQEIEEISRARNSELIVHDASHIYLDFRVSNRRLVADLYAPTSFAEEYPKAAQVVAFAELQEAIITNTELR